MGDYVGSGLYITLWAERDTNRKSHSVLGCGWCMNSTYHSIRNNTTAKYSTVLHNSSVTGHQTHTHTTSGIWISDFSLWRMMLEDRSLHIPDTSEEQRVKFSKYPLQWGHCTHRPQRTVTGTAHICNKAPINKYCTCSNMD